MWFGGERTREDLAMAKTSNPPTGRVPMVRYILNLRS